MGGTDLTTGVSAPAAGSLRVRQVADFTIQPYLGSYWRFHQDCKEHYRLSFFDEDEPPRTEPRTATRAAPRPTRRRRPSGTGGRRPPDQQSIQVRRAIALGALLVIVLLIALGIHSCDVSSTNSALQNYTNNVSSLIARSGQNGTSLFDALAGAAAKNSPTTVQQEVNQALQTADGLLHDAQHMSVPGQVAGPNRYLVLALRMRADGISDIASEIQPVLGGSPTKAEINDIAAQTATLYSSDVVYKRYAAPGIAAAVNAAGVRFSPLNGSQFVPDVEWVLPSFIASELHATVPGLAPAKIAPGLHGHALYSVAVAGTTLQTGGADNTLPAKPAPTFTLNFANTGTNNETDVVCKVSVSGTSVSGTSTVPETYAGKSATCQVKLNSTPPTGTQTVVATIEKVPGETNLSNNSLSYTVTFQ